MASDQAFVDFVVDQIAPDCDPTARKMFGEYALYSGVKLVALICDDRLFMKPTDGGRAFIGEPVEAPPYPGAKNCFLIEDRLEDGPWLSELVRITARERPEPKKKKPKKKKSKKKKSKE
ncbi:MAG: TfoX/Sxy family protein [Longimicrobiales bacterium]